MPSETVADKPGMQSTVDWRASREPWTEQARIVAASTRYPPWARWSGAGRERYTIGVEEELMLLDASDLTLAQTSDALRARFSTELLEHTGPETHAAVLELKTDIHSGVARAGAQLARLRQQLSGELRAMGLCAASAGTYPLIAKEEIQLSAGARYRALADSMRSLARRTPTMALHVHVGVPDPEDAIRVLNGLRASVPLLLALSANSPFCEGRDGGFASERTTIFQRFPRTGIPRTFAGYAEYIQAVDGLIGSGAIPDPSFLWWDVRLQPALGTVEVRVMDAQVNVVDSAALVALVQSLARLELEGDTPASQSSPEVLAENRFLAARDGMDASLIEPGEQRLTPVWETIESTMASCLPHAEALGCSAQLENVARLAVANGADRQRRRACEAADLHGMLEALTQDFSGLRSIDVPALGVSCLPASRASATSQT
ncbi:MAG TPA: YbdK family carboxylate-amine ligase [Solirubrobacteraceae bacterium]|nr:YbdK family carboxylate-amine ligase [Solirubrobacteraceae bacterium]